MLDENANKMISYKHWRSTLKVGPIYRINEQSNTAVTSVKDDVDEKEVAENATKMDKSLRDIVLHSLIASTAVYKMEHKDSDEKSLKHYMVEQMNNHFFDYIIPSKHGKNFYLIAKGTNVDRIYVAFRGSKDLLDWKYNLQVMLRSFIIIFFFHLFLNSRFSKQGFCPRITNHLFA